MKLIQDDRVVFDFPVFHLLVGYGRMVLIVVKVGLFDWDLHTGLDIVQALVESGSELGLVPSDARRAHSACARMVPIPRV